MELETKGTVQPIAETDLLNFYLSAAGGVIFFGKKEVLAQWQKTTRDRFFLVKDNFWTRELPTTASSLFLSDFFAPTDATIVQAVKKEGYFLLGKAVLDEFACGGTGLFAAQGAVYNPLDKSRLVGGSSSGAAAAVAANIVPFALAHDTGDSVRRPASYCGIIGFKPSYGLVSRYGVIPMAASLDTVGLFARTVPLVQDIFQIIAFPDKRDLVTIAAHKKMRLITSHRKQIVVLKGVEDYLSSEYEQLYSMAISNFRKNGYQVNTVELPPSLREHLQIGYLVLCSSELVSHLNALQGTTFGGQYQFKGEVVAIQRSKLLGKRVRERLLLGSYFLSSDGLLEKARLLRNQVSQWTKALLADNEFLVFPGTSGAAPRADSLAATTLAKTPWVDNLLLLANFNGHPSINIPLGTEKNLPVSLNIDSYWGNDSKLLATAEAFLQSMNK